MSCLAGSGRQLQTISANVWMAACSMYQGPPLVIRLASARGTTPFNDLTPSTGNSPSSMPSSAYSIPLEMAVEGGSGDARRTWACFSLEQLSAALSRCAARAGLALPASGPCSAMRPRRVQGLTPDNDLVFGRKFH